MGINHDIRVYFQFALNLNSSLFADWTKDQNRENPVDPRPEIRIFETRLNNPGLMGL